MGIQNKIVSLISPCVNEEDSNEDSQSPNILRLGSFVSNLTKKSAIKTIKDIEEAHSEESGSRIDENEADLDDSESGKEYDE